MKKISIYKKFFHLSEKTLKREIESLENIKDNYPKYIITLDYDKANYNGIKQISAIDFLLGREKI